jgi:phosphoribosylamine---glycine ligase
LGPIGRKKNLLIIGSGGREHALGWKLGRSTRVKSVFFCPGNGGTENNVLIDNSDFDKLISFAAENECETIVGPEIPLGKGIVDQFLSRGLRIFGPKKAAAKLEYSKAFSKHFMKNLGIRTAPFAVFSSYKDAKDYVKAQNNELVVKADGLAAGKGVFVCETQTQAVKALQTLMLDKRFEDSGRKVIIEKKLSGKEASYIVICDGNTFVPFAVSKDHKRVYDDDKGPNTGGMGSYSPVDGFDKNMEREVIKSIIQPTISGMNRLDSPFTGFLYAGLMIDKQDAIPYVLEFNTRMGDPECQSLMVRMDSDLYPYIEAGIDKRLDAMPPIRWKAQSSVCVVMASKGYPGKYRNGQEIFGLPSRAIEDVAIFHAGTKKELPNRIVTAGGRVLCVSATGQNLDAARKKAYASIRRIRWGHEEEHYRRDIGKPFGSVIKKDGFA